MSTQLYVAKFDNTYCYMGVECVCVCVCVCVYVCVRVCVCVCVCVCVHVYLLGIFYNTITLVVKHLYTAHCIPSRHGTTGRADIKIKILQIHALMLLGNRKQAHNALSYVHTCMIRVQEYAYF